MLAKFSKLNTVYNNERAALCAALFFLGVLLSFFLGGCQDTYKKQLEVLAKSSDLNQSIILASDSFTLLGWGKNKESAHVNIYIEGDGQSWQDSWTISNDPTPPEPIGFKLALADNRPDSVLYLARPCQYIMDRRCTPLDWTTNRFSQKILNAYHQALKQLTITWKAKKFTLHAYSGGAVIGLLVAAQRHDVTSVVTFAPLLDPSQWVKHHHYTPLVGSLSPIDQAVRLQKIPQEHFIGLDDQEIPFSLSKAYFEAIPESSTILVHKIPGFTHHSDWPGLWKSFMLKR